MKKAIGTGIILLLLWTCYTDLTRGTLGGGPTSPNPFAPATGSIAYEQVKTNPGDTVLSLYEKLNPGSVVPIDQVMTDFKKLNGNQDPNKVKIGVVYNIPVYQPMEKTGAQAS